MIVLRSPLLLIVLRIESYCKLQKIECMINEKIIRYADHISEFQLKVRGNKTGLAEV